MIQRVESNLLQIARQRFLNVAFELDRLFALNLPTCGLHRVTAKRLSHSGSRQVNRVHPDPTRLPRDLFQSKPGQRREDK